MGRNSATGPESAKRLQLTSGARLTREKQGRQAPLRENGELARSASEHGGAQRLLRRRVLPQERQNLRAKPPASLHLEGDELSVRVAPLESVV